MTHLRASSSSLPSFSVAPTGPRPFLPSSLSAIFLFPSSIHQPPSHCLLPPVTAVCTPTLVFWVKDTPNLEDTGLDREIPDLVWSGIDQREMGCGNP